MGELQLDIGHVSPLGSRQKLLLAGLNGKALFIGLKEYALYLAAGLGQDLHLLSNVIDILLQDLERLAYTCRAHLQLVVLNVTVQTFLNKTAQFHTVINPDPIPVVYFNYNDIVR